MKTIGKQAKYRSPRPSSRFLIFAILVLFLLLDVAGMYLFLIVQPQASSAKKPTDTSLTHEVTTVGKEYMDALLQQNYAVMWSLLHPQAQAMWHDQATFAHYLQMRFEDYTLQSFSIGTVSPLPSWVDPETMAEYKDVETMPISLQLISRLTQEQQAQLAPQFQQPSQLLQNIPFVVQHVTNGGNGTQDQWLILKGGPADQEAPILPPHTPVSRTVGVPILMYHYITGVPDNDPNPVLRQSLSVSPELFNQQLDYLKQQGFHSITLNQLINALYYKVPLPDKPIILTFDDGYIDAYTSAYPALKAHGFTGMFYIITGKVGYPGQMNWDQLREMLANGMQMGSHTVHHADMGATYSASVESANQEVQVSQKNLQDQLGISIQHFCYPNGEPFKGHDTTLQQNVVALLATNGYVDATTDPGRTGVTQSSLTPFALLRLRIDGRNSLQFFMNTIS